MQATRNLHDHIRNTNFGQTQDIFDDPAPFYASNDVFHDAADTGDQMIEELVLNAQLLASGLFFGLLGQDPGRLLALKTRVLVEGTVDRIHLTFPCLC
jgi:hypothetical protein